MTGSLTDSVQISFAINAARSKGPAILVLVREVRASSGLNYEMVGLSVPNCELFAGRYKYEESSLVGSASILVRISIQTYAPPTGTTS